jgi:2-keto-3-deoxy-L-fuconate dehydrogenase
MEAWGEVPLEMKFRCGDFPVVWPSMQDARAPSLLERAAEFKSHSHFLKRAFHFFDRAWHLRLDSERSRRFIKEGTLSQLRLDGKRVVVTGSASGIGKAIAKLFHENGARVVLVDLRQDAVQACADELGTNVMTRACDVSDESSVTAAFEQIASGGPIDVLVNCAGISHIGSLMTTDVEDFDRLYRVNVRGTFLCMRQAVERMKAAGGGVILNMASIAATSGLPDRFAYSMTKGAVLSMTLSVARDYVSDGIRCNCLSPARVHTPFVDDFLKRNYPGQEPEMFAKLSKSQPIGRMGRADEVASLALYLCSDEAGFVTGCDYPIDGGFLTLR